MTEASPKAVKLRPDEWQQNIAYNLAALQNYVLSIPAVSESGASGVQPEHLVIFDQQVERTRAFMRAWQLSRADVPQVGIVAPPSTISAPPSTISATNATNGAGPKKRGGWPKGKKRAPKAEQNAEQ